MRKLVLPVVLVVWSAAAAKPPNFAYNRKAPLDIRLHEDEDRDGARVKDISFTAAAGGRTTAYLVEPVTQLRPPFPGILYVHWYEPREKNSNRTQFLDEAVKRDRKDDFAASVQQLWGGAGRFGEQTGGGLGTGSTHNRVQRWFLLGKPKIEGSERQKFVDEMAPLYPVKYIRMASPLLQFGKDDPYVPAANARALAAAAGDPKVSWYDGGHALDDKAVAQRVEWLTDVLRLMRSH